MEYAKLINGKLTKCVIFPNGMSVLNGRLKRNPTHEEILAAGYLPIEEQAEPENKDGFIKSSKWVQTDTAIVKKWTVKRDMRPLSQAEISKMIITQQINTLSVDDHTALRMKSYYPEWTEGTSYAVGYKVQYNGKLWRVVQAHTSQADWTPDVAASLFAKVLIPDVDVIPEWEQPDSTNPYMKGDKVTHNGSTWVSTVDNNVWEPGVAGVWEEVNE